jgi:hypothetical protein
MAPKSQAAHMADSLAARLPPGDFNALLDTINQRRLA